MCSCKSLQWNLVGRRKPIEKGERRKGSSDLREMLIQRKISMENSSSSHVPHHHHHHAVITVVFSKSSITTTALLTVREIEQERIWVMEKTTTSHQTK